MSVPVTKSEEVARLLLAIVCTTHMKNVNYNIVAFPNIYDQRYYVYVYDLVRQILSEVQTN